MANIRYVLLLILVLLTGCGDMPDSYAPTDPLLAKNLQQHAEQIKGVEHAKVYVSDPYLVVALEVSPIQRYRKVKIENKVKKYVEQKHPQFVPIISADRKLQFELTKMSFQEPAEVSKKFKQLDELLKEET